MAFAMEEGGSHMSLTFFQKIFFVKPFRIILLLSKRVLHIVWVLYYIHIVVEVTMNIAEHTSICQL